MIKKIKKINAKIAELELEKKQIQENCSHRQIFYRYHGSTGNYDPSDDGYIFEYKCTMCEKNKFIHDEDLAYVFRMARESTYWEEQ